MRIISERQLRDFWDLAIGAEKIRRRKVLSEWIGVVRRADWASFSDVRGTFNHSDVFGKCIIFDVGGNKYRIIAKGAFGIKALFIRAVLTHAEYDRKDWQPDCK
jgi:mRNA interferase HigB